MQRVVTYIDGFNLYFGLKSRGWKRFYWLNLRELSLRLLKPNQLLIATKYFTSRVSSPSAKQARQAIYIEALLTLDGFKLFEGKYHPMDQLCPICGSNYQMPNEKMTDVNIATELLTDAFLDKFDTAIVLSADSDLVAPITRVRQLFPEKRIIVAFPPGRSSKELMKACHAYFTVGRGSIKASQFDQQVIKPDGTVISRPAKWR